MKKGLCLLLTCMAVSFTIKAVASENNVKLNVGLPRMSTFEYERSLNNVLPNLRAYINYGSGELDLQSQKTKISGLGLGVRYKIPFLGYLGLGFGTLNVDYAYTQTVAQGSISANDSVDVSGKLSGILLEYGTDFRFGPVIIGGSVGYIMGAPDISAKVESTTVESEDVTSGIATVNGLPQFGVYVGYAF